MCKHTRTRTDTKKQLLITNIIHTCTSFAREVHFSLLKTEMLLLKTAFQYTHNSDIPSEIVTKINIKASVICYIMNYNKWS